jgi:hypothetical protein
MSIALAILFCAVPPETAPRQTNTTCSQMSALKTRGAQRRIRRGDDYHVGDINGDLCTFGASHYAQGVD